MARVRQDRGAILHLPGSMPGRRSLGVLVAALAVVLVAIAMIASLSRRQTSRPAVAMEDVAPAAALGHGMVRDHGLQSRA